MEWVHLLYAHAMGQDTYDSQLVTLFLLSTIFDVQTLTSFSLYTQQNWMFLRSLQASILGLSIFPTKKSRISNFHEELRELWVSIYYSCTWCILKWIILFLNSCYQKNSTINFFLNIQQNWVSLGRSEAGSLEWVHHKQFLKVTVLYSVTVHSSV